ncbi:MAG: ATP-binding protein, partial [Candidatus Marinimicrobia bacterium]|nr:ATP-binding protein [Candidatus Neomarinimicrobiota bacterium]
MPPYLAGRSQESSEFKRLLKQTTILENLVLTGLRGTGKTVLLETFKPIAIREEWYWIGTDLSESTSVSEENMALRLLTDLSVITAGIVVKTDKQLNIGFSIESKEVRHTLNFAVLREIYSQTPGLVADKLKHVLETVWHYVQKVDRRGIV